MASVLCAFREAKCVHSINQAKIPASPFVSGSVVLPLLQQKLDAEGEIQIKNWQTNLSAPRPMSFLDTLPWKKKEDGNWSVSLSDDKLPWKLAQDKATAKNAVKDVKVVCPCEDTY